MRRGTLKIQTVAGLQSIMFAALQPDFEIAAKHMQKFLAFVRVRFTAAPTWLHAKEVRLHGGVAPGKQFHAHARSGLQNFALRWAHQARIFLSGFEKRKNVSPIKACDAPQCSDRRTHLATFEGA